LKTLFIINDLRRSGAETALSRLAEQLHRLGDDVSIICLKSEGELAQSLRDQGISVRAVCLRFGPRLPRALIDLTRMIRREHPDVVQTWLYHANLIGGIASRISRPRTPVVWGIRHSVLKQESSKRTTVLVSRLSAFLSRVIPSRIVYCARKSQQTHEAAGYDSRRGEVIPSGIPITQYHPDPGARVRIRRALGIAENSRVIGIVARYHPDKDIPTFVRAATILAETNPEARFVLVGRGLDRENPELADLIKGTGYADRFYLLGPRSDIPAVLNAFDISSLSSITEGLPGSIIEAMAVGLPCVATDVGDAAEVIGRAGRTVPASDPTALAEAWRELLALDPAVFTALGNAARERVTRHYRLEATSERYRIVYRSLVES
jgi:glycosyltransferase involved in cell wall biosynthesis